MGISIILEYKNDQLIERITKEHNERYLVKGVDNPAFPYLGEVEMDDYSVFGSSHMNAIIGELLRVKEEVTDPEDKEHMDDIIRLARMCRDNPDTVLTFAG